ncbi:MAG TPA: chitinase [Ktedonobacteraceae bacterium]
MSKRKVNVWRLFALCVLGLSALLAGGKLASAHRADGQWQEQHRVRIVWPARYFAPYSNDVSLQTNLVALSQASGVRFFTLAFIEANKDGICQATWNTLQPLGLWMHANIAALRAIGGDVRVAFGGSTSLELASVCNTVPDLAAQYQAVIDTYDITHLDFDIEGQTLKNAQATRLRNLALATLQQRLAQSGRRLSISYTLPVEMAGLSPSGINLLRDAIQNGVQVDTVNLMTMDYYSKNTPGEQMGQNVIITANNVFHQLHQLYPTRSSSQTWGMMGLTPMIGVNDDRSEVFTLRDAQTVYNYAERQQMAMLSFWSIRRDRPCTNYQTAPHGCSGVYQRPYDYSQIFDAYGA